MGQQEQAPATITFIGPEGSGKTTLAALLAPSIGGVMLSVPEWPSHQPFQADPYAYAYDNQRDAMNYTVAAHAQACRSEAGPIIADSCPDRIHLVHSRYLHEQGLLKPDHWMRLEQQHHQAGTEWGNHYIFLHVSIPTLQTRILQRTGFDQAERDLHIAPWVSRRWQEIITDPGWRLGKKLLELNGEQDALALRDVIKSWLGNR